MSFSAATYRVRCDHVDRPGGRRMARRCRAEFIAPTRDRLRELMRQHSWDGDDRERNHLCREHREVKS